MKRNFNELRVALIKRPGGLEALKRAREELRKELKSRNLPA